jgi:hypothetical protein
MNIERNITCRLCNNKFKAISSNKRYCLECTKKRIIESRKKRTKLHGAEMARRERARMRPAMEKVGKLKAYLKLPTNADTILYLFQYYVRREKEDRKKRTIESSMVGGE